MLKFFGKIRKGLLTENKVSKYLLYAIGEIVLVVNRYFNRLTGKQLERKGSLIYKLSFQTAYI